MEDNEKNVKSKVLAGSFWLFMEKGGLGIIEFAVAWVLARFFLDPSDYATVGLIAIFIGFSNVFVKSGFNYSIIQKKDLNEDDKNTVFWVSTVIGVFFYIILFFAAPFVAKFYAKPILKPVMRVEAVVLIFDALSIVHSSLLEKELAFKKICIKSIVTAVFSAAIGLTLAIMGAGLWTIVAQTVSTSVIGCIMLMILSKWMPKFSFSRKSFRESFGFSSRMLTSGVINNVYCNALPIAMEKVYEENSLGYYTKAKTIPTKVSELANSAVTSIVFPSLSNYQDDKKRIKEMTRRFIVTSCFLTFALMAGLIAVAKPLILFLYSEKWAGSIVFMEFICVSNALTPINSANLQAIKALGQSRIYLKLEIIKNGIGIILLALTMIFTRKLPGAIYYVLAAQTIISFICVVINAWPNRKLMDYSVVEQIKDVVPSFLLATVMCIAAYSVTFLGLPNWLTLIIQVPVGALIYVGGAVLFKFECFTYLWNTAKTYITGRLKK